MRRKVLRPRKKTSAGKIFTGVLLGGLVGMTMKWLRAPSSGDVSRRRLNEKIKTSEGNVESQAREMVQEIEEQRNQF
ncbi:MAG TPA: YtxH domain-containing protein [Anaerolineales bacterium]|jgi:gas vesicle protein|nr:YtxH domain-containing protein [Anaerolineales bacterium]